MSSIKCRTCNTAMLIDRCESSLHATICWHQCPLCKQVRLTSEREQRYPGSMVEEESTDNAEFEFSVVH